VTETIEIERDEPHVLIEGPRWADCKFYAAWLLAAAQAEAHWQQALSDDDFKAQIESLCSWCVPNFEITACVVLMMLESRLSTSTIELYNEDGFDFCMMMKMGSFS
jgi:hypothetical protein